MSPFLRLQSLWENLHSFWRFLIAILFISGVLALALGPIKTVYQQWRITNMLQEAQEALESGRFAQARDLSLQALRQDQHRREALPIMLRSTLALNDPNVHTIAFSILGDQNSTDEDLLLAWNSLCQSGPSFLPLQSWPIIPEEKRSSLAYQLPIIDRLIQDRMLTDAAVIIRGLPEPYPVEIHCRLLEMLAKTASPAAYGEFHRSMAQQLRASPDSWPLLLEVIDEVPQKELCRDVYDALPQSALSGSTNETEDALRVLRCKIAINSEQTHEVIEDAFERFKTSEPEALARWCLQIERPDRAAESIDLSEPSEDSALYDLQVQILEASDQSEKLVSFLNSAPLDLPSWKPLTHLAAIARSSGDDSGAKRSIKAALKSATGSPEPSALIELARKAQDRQLDDLALDAWTQAIIRGTGPLPPSQSISFVIKQLSEEGREDDLYAVLNSLRFVEAGNPVIQAQHLYLACLSGRAEPRTIIEELTPLHEQYPEQLALRCILAIAHVLCREPDQADQLTNDPEIDWFEANLAYRAIRGIVLTTSNRKEEAQVFFEHFPWDALLPPL